MAGRPATLGPPTERCRARDELSSVPSRGPDSIGFVRVLQGSGADRSPDRDGLSPSDCSTSQNVSAAASRQRSRPRIRGSVRRDLVDERRMPPGTRSPPSLAPAAPPASVPNRRVAQAGQWAERRSGRPVVPAIRRRQGFTHRAVWDNTISTSRGRAPPGNNLRSGVPSPCAIVCRVQTSPRCGPAIRPQKRGHPRHAREVACRCLLHQGSARRSESTLATVTASPVTATIRTGRPAAGSRPGVACHERSPPVARRHERLPVTAGHPAETSTTGMRPASGSVRTWTRMPPSRAPTAAGIPGARAGPAPRQRWTTAWKSQPATHPAAAPVGESGREPGAGRSLSPRTTAPTLPRWIAPVAVASASARWGSSASAPPSVSPTRSPGAHHAYSSGKNPPPGSVPERIPRSRKIQSVPPAAPARASGSAVR